jgi:hypothetical protein
MQSKCLRKIALSFCGIDGSAFLSQFLQFDIGLRDITLSGCDLSRAIASVQRITVHDFASIALNSARNVSLLFLTSFFSLLRDEQINVRRLDLSDLGMASTDDFTQFLLVLSCHTIRRLRALEFNDNRMNSPQTLLFVQVLEKNRDIVSLSLNRSIDVGDSPAGFTAFLNLVSQRRFDRLSLRGDASMKFSFGSFLLPLLASEMALSLSILDITNQGIGDRGLEALTRLLERGSLRELYFDGSSANSFDGLCGFCDTVIASRLLFAEFPEHDFEKLLRLRNSGTDDQQLLDRRQDIYQRFIEKFNPSLELDRAIPLSSSFSNPAQTELRPSSLSRGKVSDVDPQIPAGLHDALTINPGTAALYSECTDGSTAMESILDVLSSIQSALAIDALIDAIA